MTFSINTDPSFHLPDDTEYKYSCKTCERDFNTPVSRPSPEDFDTKIARLLGNLEICEPSTIDCCPWCNSSLIERN